MSRPALRFALPCRVCKAKPGEPCVRRDGGPRANSHHARTPKAPCGTFGAYQRHIRNGETPCDPCAEASRVYMQRWRRDTGDVTNRQTMRIKSRVLHRLKDLHPDEYDRLLAEEWERESTALAHSP